MYFEVKCSVILADISVLVAKTSMQISAEIVRISGVISCNSLYN